MSKKQQLKPYSAAHTLPHKTERTCGGGDGLKPHAISYKQSKKRYVKGPGFYKLNK